MRTGLEERRRHRVVLRVRSVGVDRDRAAAQLGDEALVTGLLVVDATALLAKSEGTHHADAGAQEGFRDEAGVDELLEHRGGAYAVAAST